MGAAAILGTAHGVLCLDKMTWRSEVLWQTIRRHWHVAKWLLPSTLMGWTAGQAFMMMTGAVLGVATVGMLRAAQTVVGVVHILLLGMDNFAPIHASQVFQRRGSEALYHYLKNLTWKGASAVLLLLLIINVNATKITQLMYGTDYPDLGPLMLAVSIIYIGPLLSVVLGVWALAIEATEVVFVSLAASTAVAVLVAYPFVVFGGVAGTLSGIFLVEFIRVCILFTALRRKASAVGKMR
jgi:O-antigen/teichoic acid export membrane protein